MTAIFLILLRKKKKIQTPLESWDPVDAKKRVANDWKVAVEVDAVVAVGAGVAIAGSIGDGYS